MINNLDNLCAICGEVRPEKFKIWFDGYLKLYRCKQCEFVAQFPGPGKHTIVSEYKDKYSLDFLKKSQKFMYPERKRVLKDIVDRISVYKAKGDFLDIGCGDGHFLYLCSKQGGVKCHGVEASEVLSSYSASISGANIIQGLYTKEMFPENSFDVITLIQVLEHISTPIKTLNTVGYHLRSNGILVIEIPSIRAPHFLAYRLTKIKYFVKPPSGIITSHFGYYDPNTLLALTKKCGFKKKELLTGRWKYKYSGFLKVLGQLIDPLLNFTKIGGILYIGQKNRLGPN